MMIMEYHNPVLLKETVDGLNLIDEILNVKNFDGIFIGPYDLSASLGIVGKFKSKKFISPLEIKQ